MIKFLSQGFKQERNLRINFKRVHVSTVDLVLAYRTELPSRYSADKGFSRTGAESEFQEKLGCELGKNSADKGFPRTGAESEFQEKLGCELGKKLRNPYKS